ncbi:hypothetical protein CC80DRAFT_95345 [Byssothecium circinans]|uniref:Aldehyde dehydrogenase domain-containing protein n=1 Tax=Byssothecium circinans TaxID=147558 RepID=A0A6A5UCL6_9PLEO|nr:hypothetical protein CC80DRAFT_95345 [Byssothecium circinans]
MLEDTKGKVLPTGARSDWKQLKIGIVLVNNVDVGDTLLSEEIFGPVLPVVVNSTRALFWLFKAWPIRSSHTSPLKSRQKSTMFTMIPYLAA